MTSSTAHRRTENRTSAFVQGVLAAAAVVCLFEFGWAYQRDQWDLMPSAAWWGLLAGAAVHAVALLFLSALLRVGLAFVAKSSDWLRWPLAVLAAVVVWGFALSVVGESDVRWYYLLAPAGALALAWYGAWWRDVSTVTVSRLVLLACAGGVGMLGASRPLFFLTPWDTPANGGYAIAVWAVVVMAVSGCVLLWRRSWAPTVAVALIAVWLPWAAATVRAEGAGGPPADGPNVVLITIDTLRAQSLHMHGGAVVTPAMEAEAARGVVFDRGYSLANWTVPSMWGMFYSTYMQNLTPEEVAEIDPNFDVSTTLANRLRDKGYATAAFIGNYLLDTDVMKAGFDSTRSYHFVAAPGTALLSRFPLLEGVFERYGIGYRFRRPLDTTPVLTDLAVEFLERKRGEPFLLWVHYMDPHGPYSPPQAYRTAEGDWPFYQLGPLDAGMPDPLMPPEHTLTDADRAWAKDLYEGEIRYVDDNVGRLLTTLDELDLRENSYVCIVSDHGEELWEHGGRGHRLSLHDHQIYVPWTMSGPGVVPSKDERAASGIDIMPTLAELVGLEPSANWRGQSLAAQLRGGTSGPRSGVYATGTLQKQQPHEPGEAYVEMPYKLVRGMESGRLWLFDLAADPGERHNLSDTKPAVVKKMLGQLEAHRARSASGSARKATPSEEQDRLEQLKSMGYVN